MTSTGPKRSVIRDALLAERATRQTSPERVRVHENSHVKTDNRESSLESLEHSVGCPKYKAASKSKCQLRSPSRAAKVLHPKPWGARDPKEIPCTCFTMRKSLKSAPPSVRNSPMREIRKTLPRRSSSPRSSLVKSKVPQDAEEVMKMFDDFCDQVDKMGVKLSSSEIDVMFNKMKTKLSSNAVAPTSVARSKVNVRGKRRTSSAESTVIDKKLPEVPQDHRSLSTQSQLAGMSQRTSSSTVRGKVETNNLVLELSGPIPDQTNAFSNIFGSMLPSDRFNYVALGGNQFFGPGEVLSPGIPTATILIDSTEYMNVHPADVVLPARLPRSPVRRRRP